jgi:lipid-A-disaccharide synthase-like uncharacterized protein
MELFMWELIGLLGMLAIEASYLPQIYRLQKKKRAEHISAFFPGLNLMGRLFALSYSLHLGQAVLGFGFLVGVMLRALFLVQVIYYQHQHRPPAQNHVSGSWRNILKRAYSPALPTSEKLR